MPFVSSQPAGRRGADSVSDLSDLLGQGFAQFGRVAQNAAQQTVRAAQAGGQQVQAMANDSEEFARVRSQAGQVAKQGLELGKQGFMGVKNFLGNVVASLDEGGSGASRRPGGRGGGRGGGGGNPAYATQPGGSRRLRVACAGRRVLWIRWRAVALFRGGLR